MNLKIFQMSKKRSFNKEWCTPSFEDGSVMPKKSTKKQNFNVTDDMDESLFDIAIDIVDKGGKQDDDNFLRDNIDNDNDDDDVFNLSALMKLCEPKVSSELALSRQKKNEISNWLTFDAKHGKPTILVISGPAGCGKTLAFKLLAEEHGFAISEWITPVDQIIDENGRTVRQGDKFLDFVLRATRYSNIFTNNIKRLLLVKDLPNIFMDDHKGFFSILEKYNELGKDPLVFICTEGGHSRLMTTLFAHNVREQYNISLININATTQTAMKNMLTRVSKILNSKGMKYLHVTQNEIEEILTNNIGDIRSALLNLIFCSLKVSNLKKLKSDCGSREDTLGLLHGIGRVINPKRINEGDSWRFTNNPDEMATFFSSHAKTFLYFLHENYMNTMRTIEEVELATDILSLTDLLNAEWKDPTLNSVILSLCVRGVMVANENPVTGWNPVRKPRNVDFDIKRNYEQAEIQWYESVINKGQPKKDKVSTNTEVEGIIETD